jgi:transitional endoplasmic reticulum ATPase
MDVNIKKVSSEEQRWPVEEVLEAEYGSAPDRCWFLGGANDGEDDCDLYLLHWLADDEPEEYRVLAVTKDENGDIAHWDEDAYEVLADKDNYIEVLAEAVDRAVDFEYMPESKPVADREQARASIPEPPASGTTRRNHRKDAVYLGDADCGEEDGDKPLIYEMYVVPHLVKPANGRVNDHEVHGRIYAVHKHNCSEFDGWWDDGQIPRGAGSHAVIREAIIRANNRGYLFRYRMADMAAANKEASVIKNPTVPNHPPIGPNSTLVPLPPPADAPSPETTNASRTTTTALAKKETTEMTTMTTDIKSKKKFTHVTVIESKDEQIHLPSGMSKAQARKWLQTLEDNEEQVINWSETIDAYPLDGALALSRVLERRFGGAVKAGAIGWFGMEIPPFMVAIEVAVGKTEHVPWGYFTIPPMPEHKLFSGIDYSEKQVFFKLHGEIKRKYQPMMEEIVAQVRAELKSGSIYKGQAFRMKFPTEDEMKERDFDPHEYAPRFIDVAAESDRLILSDEVRDQVQTNLFAPVQYTEACEKHGIPLKRGVLLEGAYGTGKTLTAKILSKICVDNNWTFVYLKDVQDLERAMRFARRYEPAVIFAEDIDSVMIQKNGSQRDDAMNSILNTIDGVDMKSAKLIVVLTSNFVDRINKAMLRPGRLDAVIHVSPPDAKAVAELMRYYSHGLLNNVSEDELKPAAEKLSGQIPSVIREVVERSKLAAIHRASGEINELTGSDVLIAAHGIMTHIDLLKETPMDNRSDMEKAADRMGGHLKQIALQTANGASKTVKPELDTTAPAPRLPASG